MSDSKQVLIKKLIQTRNDAILKRLRAGEYITDTHTGGGEFKVEAVGLKGDYLVPLYKNDAYYSINPLLLGKKGVEMSTRSIGVVYKNHGDDYERTVEEFNATATPGFSQMTLIRL